LIFRKKKRIKKYAHTAPILHYAAEYKTGKKGKKGSGKKGSDLFKSDPFLLVMMQRFGRGICL